MTLRWFAHIGFFLAVGRVAVALPVFPGAAGFGSHTVAGRGGQVYRVTNLNDSGRGSLRCGVENVEGPRVVIFDVSGVIALQSDIVVRDRSHGNFGHLTIAGQTAPPPGITLKNAGISVRSHDVLIQHLAIRPGVLREFPHLPEPANRGSIKIEAAPGQTTYNVMIDHVSCSWAGGETVLTSSDEGSIHDVTFLHSIIGESIRYADSEEETGFGALGGRNTMSVSFVGNIMACNWDRNAVIRDTVVAAEVVNNLIYWPGPHPTGAIHIGAADPEIPNLRQIVSVAGNVVIRPPKTARDDQDHAASNASILVHDDVSTDVSVYLANNSSWHPAAGTWQPGDGDAFSPEIYRAGRTVPRTWSSNPFPFTGSSPWIDDAPAVIEARLLEGAGKFPVQRDAIDTALIEKITSRTGAWIARMEDLGGNPWAPADVRRTRVLELPLNPDKDHDNDGYTNLEEWLHGWAAFVEGRAEGPPSREPGAPDQYQTPGVVNELPAFHQKLLDRVTHPLSWTSGTFTDFAAWKSYARAVVRKSFFAPPPFVPWDAWTIGEEDRGSYVAHKFVFNVSGDSRVLAYMTIPKGRGPFPAVLLLHDHGGRFDIGKEKMLRPFDVPAATLATSEMWVKRAYGGRYLGDELAKRGYVCFVTDALNWGDRGGGGSAGQEALASNLMHLGMSFAGVIAWEDLRAAEFLAEQPEVDARRIAAMGHSMGSFRTTQVTAMSDHIAAGVAVCWMGTVKSVMIPGHNETHGTPAYSMLHPGLLADLDYPDIASLACPKALAVYNGRYDRLLYQSGVEEAFRTLRTVWHSQAADDRLETRIWNVRHEFNVEMQETAFAWLDRAMDVRQR